VPALSRIAGHRRVLGLLARAIERGTLPPALLFAGPAGVGKFAVARAAAAALNCPEPVPAPAGQGLDACGRCRSCDRIERRVHVDVLEIEPDEKASIKIDVVRDVLERAAYRPFEGRRRVAIFRDADALEPQAQNALLKSLEEPPPSTVFILTTAVPGVLLPTVRSRCMRLSFGRLTEREVADVLVQVHGIAEPEARAQAALSDGRVDAALALVSADIAELRELALALLQNAARGMPVKEKLQTAAVVARAGKDERPREEIALILRMAASMLRDLELLNSGGDRQALANAVVAKELQALAPRFAGERARSAFVATDRALAALERKAGTKVVSDWIAVQL
jgi:DNA polymerase-3 subunit delta'